jgi:hypothetical protein
MRKKRPHHIMTFEHDEPWFLLSMNSSLLPAFLPLHSLSHAMRHGVPYLPMDGGGAMVRCEQARLHTGCVRLESQRPSDDSSA